MFRKYIVKKERHFLVELKDYKAYTINEINDAIRENSAIVLTFFTLYFIWLDDQLNLAQIIHVAKLNC